MVNESVRAAARQVLLKLYHSTANRLGRKPTDTEFFPVDVPAVVSQLGSQLASWADLSEDGVPISGRCDYGKSILYVDRDDPRGRWRFTVGHEIGHIVLEHACGMAFRKERLHAAMRPKAMGETTPASIARERDADLFSAELLMPERTVKREFAALFKVSSLWTRSTDAQLILKVVYDRAYDAALELAKIKFPTCASSSLTEFFGVSASAMRRRLLELSLVY